MAKTTERIDLEKLKAREQIMFFDEVLLFEDELHDHGVSMLSVKIVSFFKKQCHWCTWEAGCPTLNQSTDDLFGVLNDSSASLPTIIWESDVLQAVKNVKDDEYNERKDNHSIIPYKMMVLQYRGRI